MGKHKILNSLFFAFVFLLLFSTVKVDAYAKNDCLDDKTCVAVCNYYVGEYSSNNVYKSTNFAIYYYFDKSWAINASGNLVNVATLPDKDFSWTVKEGSFNHIFSDSGRPKIYLRPESKFEDFKSSSFVCPKYLYLDEAWLAGDNELCFDNDNESCSEIGILHGLTNFKKESKKTKDYDLKSEIEKYVSKLKLEDYDCKDFVKDADKKNNDDKDVTLSNSITSFIDGLVGDKFFYGKTVPSFARSYTQNDSSISSSIDNKVNSCITEFKNDEDLSDEKRNEYIDILNNLDKDEISSNVIDRIDDLKRSVSNATIENWNNPMECEDIFDFDEEGSVGWILNLIFNYIKVLGPVLVVLLSSVDFIKAVLGTDEKAMKEAQSKLIIRLVMAIALFLIPSIVQLLLSFINQAYCGF